MAKQKPIKLNGDTGELERFTCADDLPNQDQVDETRELIGLLVLELTSIGFQIQNKKLLNLLNEL